MRNKKFSREVLKYEKYIFAVTDAILFDIEYIKRNDVPPFEIYLCFTSEQFSLKIARYISSVVEKKCNTEKQTFRLTWWCTGIAGSDDNGQYNFIKVRVVQN